MTVSTTAAGPAASTAQVDLASPQPTISVAIAPASTADDAALIAGLTSLINAVFIEAEKGIWNEGFQRTSEAAVTTMIRDGQLALAYLDVDPSLTTKEEKKLVGCACIKQASPDLAMLSMLTLDAAYHRRGYGRVIMAFVEEHARSLGCSMAGLDLLVPTAFEHALKTRMQAWYLRLGYKIVKLGRFEDEYPALAPLLTGPADFKIFEKPLV